MGGVRERLSAVGGVRERLRAVGGVREGETEGSGRG